MVSLFTLNGVHTNLRSVLSFCYLTPVCPPEPTHYGKFSCSVGTSGFAVISLQKKTETETQVSSAATVLPWTSQSLFSLKCRVKDLKSVTFVWSLFQVCAYLSARKSTQAFGELRQIHVERIFCNSHCHILLNS